MKHHKDRFNPDTDTIIPGQRGRLERTGTGERRLESSKSPQRQSSSQSKAGQSKAGSRPKNRRTANQRKRRKKTSGAFKVLALIFIVLIVAAAVFFIRSFGAGTKSDDEGMKAYNSGDYAKASQLFSEAIRYDKTNAQYYVHLGMSQIQEAKFEEALATFEQAKSRTHQKSEIQAAERGKGIACLYKGDYSGALDAFSSALESAGSRYTAQEIDILFYLAEAQAHQGDSVGSVLTYTKIIEQTGNADAYMLRGMAYQKVGDNTNAEKDLYKALEMNQKNYKVYLSLYRVLFEQGKEREAEKLLKEALTLTAKTGEDYTNQGLIYMYLEEFEQALTAFDTAVSEGYTEAYFGKAQNYMHQENYEEAIGCFDLYFTEHTDNALAYNEYGVCLEKARRYAEAASAFATGIALNDRTVDAQLRFNEVNALEKMGQWQAAYEKMQEYVAKYPEDEAAAKELIFLESRQN